MPSRPRPARLLAPLALVAALTTATACGGHDEPVTKPPSGDSSRDLTTSGSPSASDTATESPSPSQSTSDAASESASPGPSGPAPAALLLPAARMPGFNDTWSWRVKGTGPQQAPFGICQRFPMDTLGADRTVVRRYVPAGGLSGGTAGHLVSRFVDDTSAAQAQSVLRSWHDRCRERLTRYATKRVGPVTSVATARGTASWYLVSYTEKGADEGRFDALGVLRDGSTVELLALDLSGQDYSYESGREPMVQALKNAADGLPAG